MTPCWLGGKSLQAYHPKVRFLATALMQTGSETWQRRKGGTLHAFLGFIALNSNGCLIGMLQESNEETAVEALNSIKH